MREVKLLVDMDSTICDTNKVWIDAYNKKYGTNITEDQFVHDWDFRGLVNKGIIKSYQSMIDILKEPGLYNKIEPIPGAIEALRECYDKLDVDIYIVTSPVVGPQCIEKYEWVRNHAPFIDDNHVILCHDKWMINGDIIWDDGPKNIQMCNHLMYTIATRFPYNEDSNPDYFIDDPSKLPQIVASIADIMLM